MPEVWETLAQAPIVLLWPIQECHEKFLVCSVSRWHKMPPDGVRCLGDSGDNFCPITDMHPWGGHFSELSFLPNYIDLWSPLIVPKFLQGDPLPFGP